MKRRIGCLTILASDLAGCRRFERGFTSSSLGEFGQSLWSPQIETFEREGQLVIRADESASA